jgi:hypothetical protein
VADVKDAAVARPLAPERDRLDVACGCHSIAGRCHDSRFSRRAGGRLLPVIAVDHDRSDVHVNLRADDPITPNCA